MEETIATYTDAADRPHAVVLVIHPGGALVVDRGPRSVCVVCALETDEGRDQALAVLEGGAYLERARASRRPLCRALSEEERAMIAEARAEAGGRGPARAA